MATYRGTTTYFRVTAELVSAAEHGGLTTYQDIAIIMGLPLRGSYMGAQVGQVLGEISEDEIKAGRPMLSALAVGTTGKPGPGFITWAQTLGRVPTGESTQAFWNNEREAVYQAWKRPLRGSRQTAAGTG